MTDLERKIKAKIPGEDAGIEIRKSFCDICAPGMHCGVDAYVKDGKIIKVEGTPEHPMNRGLLCTKGAGNRAYIYRDTRLRTPLKRVGKRGEGLFEPISWDEAYDIISERLLAIRKEYGGNSVAFYTGYEKWYRFLLQRFAYSFGSVNYGTESGTCFTSALMAWQTMTGDMARPDMANSKLYIAWGSGNHHSNHLATNGLDAFAARGGKIIVVDTRKTPAAQRDAALWLCINPGTDGLLANCIAGIIIRSGWQDQEYIDKYVHGYEAYREHVLSIDVEETARVCGIPAEQIMEAARLIGTTKPMSCSPTSTPIMHHTNGYQTTRAIIALLAITGNYDVPGGNLRNTLSFCHQASGYTTWEDDFAQEPTPAGHDERIGAREYPVWGALVHEMQGVELPRQILEETPYPVKAVVGMGMNYRIFPQSDYTRAALEKLDFFVTADLFMTDTCKLADIVLPVCSSFEREEMKIYPGGFAKYYLPIIEPVGESRSDAQILQELAERMDLDDDLMRAGYRACIDHVFRDVAYDIDELIASPLPLKAKGLTPPKLPYGYLESGCQTPSGKLELWSEVVAACPPEKGLNPLPVWEEPPTRPTEDFPFILLTGVRLPNALHSRLHEVSWHRSLRPDPAADISPEDAAALGIAAGDSIRLYNELGEITVKANPQANIRPGQVYIYHGYPEADVNLLIGREYDPYSGFPGYKCGRCNICKV